MEKESKSKFYWGVLILAFACAALFIFFLQNGKQIDPAFMEKGLNAYEQGDYAKALDYFKLGDENDDPRASFILGAMYLNGQGVEKNAGTAERLYIKAAENGYTPAMTTLGILYATGEILPLNADGALYYLTEAAERNDPDAQITLATWYENGSLGKKDVETAVRWYTKAARNGNKDAKMALALIYREGKGLVPPNIFASKRWYDSIERQSVFEKRFQGEKLDISR